MKALISLVVTFFKVKKIESDAKKLFDKEIEEMKDRLVRDESIKDDDLQRILLEEIEKAGERITKEVECKVQELTKKSV